MSRIVVPQLVPAGRLPSFRCVTGLSPSPIRLSVVVRSSQAVAAVQCLHTAFNMDSDSVFVETQLSAEEIAAKMAKGR